MHSTPSRRHVAAPIFAFLLLLASAAAVPVAQARASHVQLARVPNCLCGPNYADGTYPYITHIASASNSAFDYTILDNPYTNGQPNAVLMVTQFWNNPRGTSSGVFNNHNIGVWYDGTQWTIFNEDGSAIPAGATFDVLVQSPSNGVYVATATSQNIAGDYTVLNNALLNNNPSASVYVTPVYGATDLYNNHPIGVWYTGSNWAIFNEDGTAMQAGEMFAVTITVPVGADCYQQHATAANTNYDYTTLSDGLSNNPGLEWETHNYGTSGPYVDDPTAMFVYGSPWGFANSHGAIFTEDLGPLSLGATFNYCVMTF
jgi:hypothetical protein